MAVPFPCISREVM